MGNAIQTVKDSVETNKTVQSPPNDKVIESTDAELNDELIEKKTKPLIDEFFHEMDNAIETVKGSVEIKKTVESPLNDKVIESTDAELNDELIEKKTKPLIDEFLHEMGNAIETVKGSVEANKTVESPLTSPIKSTDAELNDELIEKKTKPLIDEFLHKNDFESNDGIQKDLLELLENVHENDEIIHWIDVNVPDNTKPTFIRALVSAALKNAIKYEKSMYEFNPLIFVRRIKILCHYIDHNDDLELQALFAIQALMNELNHPKGMLRNIFDILYDDDVITDESFKNWERNEDPDENKGKEVALASVKSFFTWLRECESCESAPEE